MDKKTIIAIVILAILVIFYWPIMTYLGFVEEPEETIPVETSADSVSSTPDFQPQATSPEPQTAVTQPGEMTQLIEAQPDTVAVDSLVIETEKYQVIMSSLGGGPVSILLKDYVYRDGEPIQMLPGEVSATPAAVFGSNLSSSDLHFTCNRMPGNYDATDGPLEVVYSYTASTGGTLERKFTFYPEKHHFDLKIDIDDPSGFGDRTYRLGWNTSLAPTEPDLAPDWEAMQAAVMYAGSRESLDDFEDGRLRQGLDGRVDWAGVRSKYFAAVLIPQGKFADGAWAEGREVDARTADGGMLEERHITAGLEMAFAAVSPITDSFTVYVGPLDYMMMSDYDVGLQDMLDIGTTPYVGWLIKPFAIGIMWLLPKMYGAIPNYGIVIILFALMVKIITLPLSMKSFKSMQAMKDLQPKIEEMKKRFKKDPQKLNKEMMKMYKTHGVNPMSGCLPIIPQMPLFFALFSVFRSTILLRDAPFFWFIDDLSRGAQSLTDPYMILVVLMVGAQFVSQKVTMPTNQQNKMLGYLMPLFMGFIFYKFAAGLVLYWTAFSVLAMLDYVLFKRSPKNPEVKTAG